MDVTSSVVKKHIVFSLTKLVQNIEHDIADERAAAACFELCICHASGFGTDSDQSEALKWLVQAARSGILTAQSVCHNVISALGLSGPSATEIDHWLVTAAQKGSWTALQSLRIRDSSHYKATLEVYRRRFLISAEMHAKDFTAVEDGPDRPWPMDPSFYTIPRNNSNQTMLHWAAAQGNVGLFQFLATARILSPQSLDVQDATGDTPLIHACRAGRHAVAIILLFSGVTAKTSNLNGENPLHFLYAIDENEVRLLAELLVEQGADCSQEAKESSTNPPRFDPTVLARGCPLTRAVTLNKPLLVKTLLDLIHRYRTMASTEDFVPRERKLWRSTLCKLYAWGCRLQNHLVLEELSEPLKTALGSEAPDLTLSIRNQLYSFPALTIDGYVSDSPLYGYDFPERFWRYMYHGKNHQISLFGTIGFQLRFGANFHDVSCCGERSALFYAIKKGRADAVSLLIQNFDESHPFRAFGTLPSRELVMSSHETLEPHPERPNHSYREGLVEAVRLCIRAGKDDIFNMLLKTHASEALNPGIVFPVYYDWLLDEGNLDDNKVRRLVGMSKVNDVTQYFPKLFGFDSTELSDQSDNHPIQRMKGRIFQRKRTWPSTEDPRSLACLSDGRINYALLYMTLIIESPHRDLNFAIMLLHHIEQLDFVSVNGWKPANFLEQVCFKELSQPVLLVAAKKRWHAIIHLLLQNGANLGESTFKFRKSQNTIWSYLWQCDLRSLGWIPYFLHYNQRPDWPWRQSAISAVLEQMIDTKPSNTKGISSRAYNVKLLRILIATDFTNSITSFSGDGKEIRLLSRLTGIENLHADDNDFAAELWKYIARNGKSKLSPRDSEGLVEDFVLMAAMRTDYPMLKALLELKYSPNGRWWNPFWLTPLDVLSILPPGECVASDESHLGLGERARCRNLLLEAPTAQNGPGLLLEFHVFASLLLYASIVGLIIALSLPMYFLAPLVYKFLSSQIAIMEATAAQSDSFTARILIRITCLPTALSIVLTPFMLLPMSFIFAFLPTCFLLCILSIPFLICYTLRRGVHRSFYILLPSLIPVTRCISKGDLIDTFPHLRGPTASLLHAVARILFKEQRAHRELFTQAVVVDNVDEREETNEDHCEDIETLERRLGWSRRSWWMKRLKGIQVARRLRPRLVSVRSADSNYAGDDIELAHRNGSEDLNVVLD